MTEKDLAIIGGGPAGLAAGIYTARADIGAVLFEQAMPGGLAASTDTIENYPGFADGISGPALAQSMETQARRFGLSIIYGSVEKIRTEGSFFILETDEEDFRARTVIIATGAMPNMLQIPGEKEYHGRGVSYCATCDGALFRDKSVAVIGGGDSALEEALFLTRFASGVTVVHRRDELRATRYLQTKAMNNSKIDFRWSSLPVEIKGGDQVEGLVVRDIRSGETELINVQGVFVYVGHSPNTGLVRDLVDLDDKGYIITDEQMRTGKPGLFAAGDVRSKLLRQVVTAVADGAIAAFAAEKHLSG